MTFELVDLEDLGERAVGDFSASIAANGPAGTAQLEGAAGQLAAKVQFAYGVAAKLAGREQTLESTAAVWAKMTDFCDHAARQVRELAARHPACKVSLDRILDFRNAAEKRRALHA